MAGHLIEYAPETCQAKKSDKGGVGHVREQLETVYERLCRQYWCQPLTQLASFQEVKRNLLDLYPTWSCCIRAPKKQESREEMVTQLATIEMLINAMKCFEAPPGEWNIAQRLQVEQLNPTTNGTHKNGDTTISHDLILRTSSQPCVYYCIEVSDVSGERDGNGKMGKDPHSLRTSQWNSLMYPSDPKKAKSMQDNRYFLACSKESVTMIRCTGHRPWGLKWRDIKPEPLHTVGTAHIVEITNVLQYVNLNKEPR